jgi:hypothetical protein
MGIGGTCEFPITLPGAVSAKDLWASKAKLRAALAVPGRPRVLDGVELPVRKLPRRKAAGCRRYKLHYVYNYSGSHH